MYLSRKAQIAHLKVDEAPSEMPSKNTDFADIFFPKLTIKLSEHTKINDHAIELVDDWQPPYGHIYSLEPVEVQTLKAYIKNNLAISFTKPFKFPAGVLILFGKKPDCSLRLCVDYQVFDNLTIKNGYPLPLFGESLDWLDWAWSFTKLDLTNTYYQMRIREGDKWKTAFKIRYGHFRY